MAAPFKRMCLNVTRHNAPPPARLQQTCQRHTTRSWSSTARKSASAEEPPTQHELQRNEANELAMRQLEVSPTPSDTELDRLALQPGVKYTSTTAPEDLSGIDLDNMSSLAQRQLEQHRELREITRIAAWEMPLLSTLATPFRKPSAEQILRWRYTTYMGESHPAQSKVVLEFQPSRLDMSAKQRLKLLKLVGARYNPSTETVKMSCESFETQAQNKRYLLDTLHKVIAEAKDDNADSFEDVPLDLRHHKVKEVIKFPTEWRLTPERKAYLDQKRNAELLEEAKRVEDGTLVSGAAAIEAARKIEAEAQERKAVAEPVLLEARPGSSTAPRGRNPSVRRP